MCGIWALIQQTSIKNYGELYASFMKIKHRGPDYSSFDLIDNNLLLGFHRLAIMDLTAEGNQPFHYVRDDGSCVYCICNGEIYEYERLKKEYGIVTKSHSDCEVIIPLYEKLGVEGMIKLLGSEFAFILVDISKDGNKKVICGRDPLGVRPLFYSLKQIEGIETVSEMCMSSEIKGLSALYNDVYVFPPGHYMIYENGNVKLNEYYSYNFKQKNIMLDVDAVQKNVRDLLIDAVNIRLASDKEIGFLLSGGLDSSLICGIAKMLYPNRKFKAFTISFDGGVDLPFAKEVIEYLGWEHHIINVTEEEALNAINETIYYTETFDITSVRCSVVQLLVGKYIKENTNVRVLNCGETSDEIFSGYLYHHYAPSDDERYKDSVRLVHDIHCMDGLRTDRTMASSGLEIRLPFADHNLVDYVFSLHPHFTAPKNGLEKALIRDSFRELNIIPESIIDRVKNAFSDAVSSKSRSWYQIIQEHIDKLITDEEYKEFKMNDSMYMHCRPITKESYYYRKKFVEYFGDSETKAKTIPYFWMPKWIESADPSARKIGIVTE